MCKCDHKLQHLKNTSLLGSKYEHLTLNIQVVSTLHKSFQHIYHLVYLLSLFKSQNDQGVVKEHTFIHLCSDENINIQG
jgi:hypothetical protein